MIALKNQICTIISTNSRGFGKLAQEGTNVQRFNKAAASYFSLKG
jgi:hypothetical protein